MQGAETDPKFWNTSLDGKNNRGKLTYEQTQERARLHAERLAYGRPTIQTICDHWMAKYGISMTYGSEKEWCSTNEAMVLEVMNQMVESGEIKLTISDQSLLNTINVSGSETGRTLRQLESKFNALLGHLDPSFDPFVKAGITEEEYEALDAETKKKVNAKMRKLSARQNFIVQMLPKISNMVIDHKRLMLDTILATKEIYDDSTVKKLAVQKEVQKQVVKHIDHAQKKSKFDPLEVEISEDDRKALDIEPG